MAGGYRPRWGCSRSSRRIAVHLGGRGVVADGLNASTTAWRPSARNCTTTRERWPAPFPTPILQLVVRYVLVVRGVMLPRADSYRQSSQASRRDRTVGPLHRTHATAGAVAVGPAREGAQRGTPTDRRARRRGAGRRAAFPRVAPPAIPKAPLPDLLGYPRDGQSFRSSWRRPRRRSELVGGPLPG
jgi:hypothetical protein